MAFRSGPYLCRGLAVPVDNAVNLNTVVLDTALYMYTTVLEV